MIPANTVVQHYGETDLRDRLRAALEAAGLDTGLLSTAELAPIDQFHTRGIAATAELAQAAGIRKGLSVLDIGSGLGGPSARVRFNHKVVRVCLVGNVQHHDAPTRRPAIGSMINEAELFSILTILQDSCAQTCSLAIGR
jgi:hypothetical protein